MAKSAGLTRISAILRRPNPFSAVQPPVSLFLPSKPKPPKTLFTKPYSTTATPFPLQYDMIISRPAQSNRPHQPRRPRSKPTNSPDSEPSSEPESELGFDDWVDKKLTHSNNLAMDKSKRKYYNKRRKRMYGSDSDDENSSRDEDNYVELKPEVVELRTLHKKEEELYFYDTFAYPWEAEKHYKMVYQLEKKYFPDQCFDKAFLEPGQTNEKTNIPKKRVRKNVKTKEENEGLVFFDETGEEKDEKEVGLGKDAKRDVSERKVEEFFKSLKKFPNEDGGGDVGSAEPFVVTRSTGLPPRWDSPAGTVVLVNKPKGWTSFTVCGKLRRLVNVKKVGHAGTLDPMATGLLIVCIGKATKLVDRYQGMIKGYSGVFRLGETTSTLDADSPVIQREPWEHIKDNDIKKAATSFYGEIWQVPPMFSAIKIGGEKMYEKARRGENIELSPRRISIFQFDVERSLDDRQNVIFRVTCSKGTYIRSLCADFGKALGSCAHLTALRRDSIGEYSADNAWEFEELEKAITKDYL